MFNTMTALGTMVYVNHFKLTPALAGLALGLPRIFDAITDPIIGNMSDNCRSRFGRHREGMFSAVKGFGLKAAQGLTFGPGGYMATAAGYDPQIVERAGLDESTAWKMKADLVGFQCAGLLLAIVIMWLYPITRQRAEETQRKLREAAI
jgi:GPH family glycoside/pentoside/hexuronide:cation symporter